MTYTRISPSGPKVEIPDAPVGNVPAYSGFRLSSNVALTVAPVNLFAGVKPLFGAPAARLCLVTACLLLVNSAGFDGAPIAGAVGLQRNGDTPFNLGPYRALPTGPGIAGAPLLWISSTVLTIAPDDEFTLFASSTAAGGAAPNAATVTSLPASGDAASVLSFLFP